MTTKANKVLLATVIVAIGAIMLTSTMTSEAEAKTKGDTTKYHGDNLSAYGSNVGAYAQVYASVIANSNDIAVSYYGYDGITYSQGYCIADKSVLQGSGSSNLALDVDLTGFTVVASYPTQAGECAYYSTGLGPVSADISRDGLSNYQSNGVSQQCSTYAGVEYCYKQNGNQESGSATITSGNVLGFDLTTATYQSASAGKQNIIYQQWTNP